jgi:hypothetical protein
MNIKYHKRFNNLYRDIFFQQNMVLKIKLLYIFEKNLQSLKYRSVYGGKVHIPVLQEFFV